MSIAKKFKHIAPRSPKANLTRLILEKIAEGGEILLDSFFPAKYPEVRLWRKIIGLAPSYAFKRPTFVAILSQLKAQGLVEGTLKRGRTHWRLTQTGRTTLIEKQRVAPPRPDGKKRLICFDIPEHDRAKRQWLRGELIACGYRQLQKSVWIGDVPLPSDFVATLDALELLGCVHILRVESKGTLDQ